MILQEKIKKKAEGFGKLAPVFLEAADYALNNQWISVDEDLPCNHEELISKDILFSNKETVRVLTLQSDGDVEIDFMVQYKGEWKWWSNRRHTHWFPIPKLSREVGDEFEVDGVALKVVEDSDTFSCVGCYFLGSGQNVCDFQNCLRCERKDNKSVKFVKIYD